MAVIYRIQAEVVDIRKDKPEPADSFLVDSNVWYWVAYPRCSQSGQPPRPYQITDYPAYVKQVLGAGARLLRCGLSLAELSHLIEKTERHIYSKSSPGVLRPKEYRHNLSRERATVVAEVEAAWAAVRSLAEPMNTVVDHVATESALSRFKSERVDGYDLFILEAMAREGVAQVITDDGDFATVPGIRVFTSNANVVKAAKAQGKLVLR